MIRPILFNTEMVKAILEGRKTVTRRIIKPQPEYCTMSMAGLVVSEKPIEISDGIIKAANAEVRKPPFEAGDILYVRETWARSMAGTYLYKATDTPIILDRWRPSIHMPKEAARIFLRVTDVRVERLWRMDTVDALAEGMRSDYPGTKIGVVDAFCKLWDSTIKPADLPLYGWNANPWVWVIEFNRCDKPEGFT